MSLWMDYDDVDLSSSQSMDKSIGAQWANGAFTAFYKITLEDITQRMSLFEENHPGVTFLVKKLIIICPLSCNANGSLAGKDGHIKPYKDLKEIILDEGANNNRTLKHDVYEITSSESYIAAEIPSPLSTLYEMRDCLDGAILQYHRKCFIETLKDLLKGYPCIILEYDDLNPTEELHSFLLSNLDNRKFVSVLQ